jgi:hypothetical protein
MPRRKTNKGTPFERAVCKRLSLWWTNNVSDSVFWRTQTSGARATARGKKGLSLDSQQGDISTIDPIGVPLLDLITWELKRGYNRSTLHDLLDKPGTASMQEWEKWIQKAEECHVAAGSYSWAIIHQRDRREPVIAMPLQLIDELFPATSNPAPSIEFTVETGTLRQVFTLYATTLETFLKHVTPQKVKLLARHV